MTYAMSRRGAAVVFALVINENFVWLGLACSVTGVSAYVYAIVRGRVQPNKLSWLILGIAPLVAFAAEVEKEVGLRSVVTLAAGVMPLVVVAASFVNKKAYWKLNRFDMACGGLAVLALILWRLTGEGNVAIALSVAADSIAILPIVVKAWRFPHSETPVAFAGVLVNASIAILVLNRYTFADLAFPVYLLISALILEVVIIGRQRMVSRPVLRPSSTEAA